jgi:hypothetical protein
MSAALISFHSGSFTQNALLISTLPFMSYIRHKLMKCNLGVNLQLENYEDLDPRSLSSRLRY